MTLSNPKKHSGFTIIEILIALLIGIMLIGGIIQVFISLKQTNSVANALSRIQESTRITSDIFMNGISHAGNLGCIDLMDITSERVAVQYTSPPTHINNYLENYVGVWESDTANWGDGTGLEDIDELNAVKQAKENSDVLRIMYLSPVGSPLKDDITDVTDDLVLANNVLGVSTGDILAVGNCNYVGIFKVTDFDNDTLAISHGTGSNITDEINFAYEEGDMVRRLRSLTYFVGDTGRTNKNGDSIFALFRKDAFDSIDEIIDGVEDMQILIGEENAVDNQTINNTVRYVNASESDLVLQDATVIKIALMMTSNDPVLTIDDSSTYQLLDQELKQTGTTITYNNDRRLRRVVNISVNIRNKRAESDD